MSDVVSLTAWRALPRSSSRWRRRARLALDTAIRRGSDAGMTEPKHLLKLADANYPFGQRSHHPYKMWLAERALLIKALGLGPEPPPEPTAEDYATCEVAIDLVEQDDAAGAEKLLDEQAPRRLNRDCPACGAKSGAKCIANLLDKWCDGQINTRIVPHLARVTPHPKGVADE